MFLPLLPAPIKERSGEEERERYQGKRSHVCVQKAKQSFPGSSPWNLSVLHCSKPGHFFILCCRRGREERANRYWVSGHQGPPLHCSRPVTFTSSAPFWALSVSVSADTTENVHGCQEQNTSGQWCLLFPNTLCHWRNHS